MIEKCGTDTVAGAVCVGSVVVPERKGNMEIVLVIVVSIVLMQRRNNRIFGE